MDGDDDLYGGTGDDAQGLEQDAVIKAENEVDMDGDQEEEDESDDDVHFTLEKPEGAKSSTPAAQVKKQEGPSDSKRAKTGTPIKTERQQRSSSTAPASQQQQQQSSSTKATLTHGGKEGKDFPAVRTSTLDVNATPTWPENGKPITEVDIDADLAENSKLWRLPGTDQTDFFNYGFDEFTWAQYAIRQQTMVGTIQEQKKQDEAMKAMFGGGPPGGGPGGGMGSGGGGPPGGMPGMPSQDEMMQMMAQGMTEEQFMNRMMQSGMMGGGAPPQGPGGGNFGPQGQGFGGPQGQNFGGGRVPSGSPHPQGQGFQPPTGPSGQGGQGGQDGFMGNMEGYSPQQMAIMQQQQGGGGRGRGRGRGRW